MKIPSISTYKGLIRIATAKSAGIVNGTIKRAHLFKTDPRKSERLKAQQCLSCFYTNIVACHGFTNRNCDECDTPMSFSSTETSILCIPCASKQDLCAKCGGKISFTVNGDNSTNQPENTGDSL